MQYSRSAVTYDARDAVISETTSLRRVEANGTLYVSNAVIANAYDASGLLTATTSANHRYRDGSIYENTPDTAYAYTSRADGQAASVTFRPDTAQGTAFTTTYGYDANQHLTSAQINDGRPRRVEYVNDAQGQVLVRREADNTLYSAGTGKGGDPRAYN